MTGSASADGRVTRTVTVDGTELTYTLVTPEDHRAGTSVPVLLALPPGGQGQEEVDALLDRVWAAEARRRGWVVVSPRAPGTGLFSEVDSAALIPSLVDLVAAEYPPEGGRVHLAGVSNGGLSAFRAALDHPELFRSLLVLPGMPPTDDDYAKLERLTSIPVALFVGENDGGWREGSERVEAALRELGGRVSLTVSRGEGHILRGIDPKEYFDFLESARG